MNKFRILLLGVLAIVLSNCSGAKETLGFTRNSPDEYTALERPPLSMPPSYHLNAPTHSRHSDNFGGSSQRVQAASAFLGDDIEITSNKPVKSKGGEGAMLDLANANQADRDIRHQIDEETHHLIKKDKRFTEKLLFWVKNKEPSSVVDPVAEHKRIEQNAAANKPVNEGTTKPIQDHKKAILEGVV